MLCSELVAPPSCRFTGSDWLLHGHTLLTVLGENRGLKFNFKVVGTVKIPGPLYKSVVPYQFCSGPLHFYSGRYLDQIQIDNG